MPVDLGCRRGRAAAHKSRDKRECGGLEVIVRASRSVCNWRESVWHCATHGDQECKVRQGRWHGHGTQKVGGDSQSYVYSCISPPTADKVYKAAKAHAKEKCEISKQLVADLDHAFQDRVREIEHVRNS